MNNPRNGRNIVGKVSALCLIVATGFGLRRLSRADAACPEGKGGCCLTSVAHPHLEAAHEHDEAAPDHE